MNVNERAAQMLHQYADYLRDERPPSGHEDADAAEMREAEARALANGLIHGMHFITAAPVEPDSDGFWAHPGIPDHFDEDPAPFERWLNEQLLECVTREVGDEDGGVVADWEDSKPAAAGWFLLQLIDTEDGPTAFWVRRQTATIADLREALANALEADPNTPEGYLTMAASRDVLDRAGRQDTLSQYDRGWNDHLAAAALPPLVHVVLHELSRASRKFPTWPTDPLHAMGVVNEEVGELSKAVLQAVYEPEKNPEGAVEKEALQAAAMLLRFLASLDRYTFRGAPQHVQDIKNESAECAGHSRPVYDGRNGNGYQPLAGEPLSPPPKGETPSPKRALQEAAQALDDFDTSDTPHLHPGLNLAARILRARSENEGILHG